MHNSSPHPVRVCKKDLAWIAGQDRNVFDPGKPLSGKQNLDGDLDSLLVKM